MAAGATEPGPTGGPTIRLAPGSLRPGDALLVTIEGVAPSVATSTSGTVGTAHATATSGTGGAGDPAGTPAPRPLHFFPTSTGIQAVVALPVELAPGSLAVEVRLPGRQPPLLATAQVVDPAFPETVLTVEPKFVSPSPEQKRRMEEDQAAFRRAFARPFEPPLFDGAFAPPRRAAVTGRFGERRMFNGEKRSQHYGTDLAGAIGEPVLATNDGVVVLVRDCFASGKSIAVAHGGGLFSVYFHLSAFDVAEGARVRRGQAIGKVGATGRVTGPHLHFGIKVTDLYVDPDSVYRLAFAAPAP